MMEVLYKWNPTSGSTSPSRTTDYWIVSETDEGQAEHLLVSGSSVKLFKGLDDSIKTLKTVYTVQSAVLQVLWVWFKDEEKGAEFNEDDRYVKGLCVREKGQLNIFMNNGVHHIIPLPFEVRSLWSVKGVLLIERLVTDHVDDTLAVLFTLSHPMDEICPVTSRKQSFIKGDRGSNIVSYVTSPQLRVAAVIPDHTPPLIMSYDERDNTHTLWSVKAATSKDMPSPSSTPGGVAAVMRTPGGPLSSSAPDRYVHYSTSPIVFNLQLDPTPPAVNNTNNEKRRSLLTPLHEESLKNATLKRLQTVGGGGGGGTGMTAQKGSTSFSFTPSPSLARRGKGVSDSGKSVSGRSPFVNRYLSSQQRGVGGSVKRAKSLSPVLHYARVSPYSKLTSSWSLMYSNEIFSEPFETLLPQICLHQQWTEIPESECMIYHSCVDAFVSKDFKEEKYLVYYIPSLLQARILSLDTLLLGDGDGLYSTDVTVIPNVSGVIRLINISLMLILTTAGSLELYTGNNKVSTINLSPLYNSISLSSRNESEPIIKSIRDQVGNEFTVFTVTNDAYRCSVVPLPQSSLVSLCVSVLCSVIPSHIVNVTMTSYCNSSHCPTHSSSSDWYRFESWLLSVMGLQISTNDNNKLADPLLFNDPILKLLNEDTDELKVGVAEVSEVGVVTDISLKDYLGRVTTGLHLAYEELKLNIHNFNKIRELGRLLYTLTHFLGWEQYKDHYFRDTPTLLTEVKLGHANSTNEVGVALYDVTTPPPGIYQCIYQLMNDKKLKNPYPILRGICKRSEKIMKIFSLLTSYWWNKNEKLYHFVNEENTVAMETDSTGVSCLDRLLHYLTEEGFNADMLDSFPVGVVLPIRSLLYHCRRNPNTSSWKLETQLMIGRYDVYESLVERRGRGRKRKGDDKTVKFEVQANNDNGMNFDEEILRVRFSSDLRVKEVKRLLASSEPVKISLEQKPEVSDHDFVEEQETYLLSLCQRTMSLPVGRGMFTLATSQALPTSSLNIPLLNLSGRVPPRNISVGLDHIDKPANMTDWPQFHNGVAAGLKLIPAHVSKLDSTWIVYNQPGDDTDTAEYAGFLMALGLHGHLSSLSSFNVFEYLNNKQELTVVGILLGLSANKCGTMDLSLTSLLSLYFPPLLPPESADLDVSITMQTAAAIGLGLLYMSSCNNFMIEVMLNEIGHSPGPECKFGMNRESYSLSSGLSLGMIGLAGGDNAVVEGINIVDQLCVYVNGGMKRDVSAIDTASSSQLVLEGKHVNVHVTAPGGILALGLLYLKTNNKHIAAHLAPPTTLYQFECAHLRPDFLCLRALSLGLILWDSIEPTQHWISSNIPNIAHEYSFKYNEANIPLYQTMSQSYLFIVAGSCLAIGFKFAGTCSAEAKDILYSQYKMILSHQSDPISKHCIETCIQTVLLSLSMVLSGSGDLTVLRLIRRHHMTLSTNEMASSCSYGYQMAAHMSLGLLFLGGGRYSLSNSNRSVAVLLCSLYPQYPSSSTDNRYHCQVLRHLYVLAAVPRVLVTRSVDTRESVSVPLTLHTVVNGVCGAEERKSPCLLPDWDIITAIEVGGPRYWPVKYKMNKATKSILMETGTVYVKRCPGYSSYESDPWGQKSILSLAVLSPSHYQVGGVIGPINISRELLANNHYINQFYNHFCHHSNEFYSSILLECIARDQLELINVFLQLEEMCNKLDISNSSLWQVKLCNAYSANNGREGDPVTIALRDFIKIVSMRLNKRINDDNKRLLSELLLKYLTGTGGLSGRRGSDLILLSLYLILKDIPLPLHQEITDTQSIITLLHSEGVRPGTIVDIVLLLSSSSL